VVRELVSAFDRSDLSSPFPVHVRLAAGDDIPLSTASGRDTGHVVAYADRRSPHPPHFGVLEAAMKSAGGRPHRGMMHSLGAADLRGLYPRFDEFLAVRAEADPRGIFANTHLDRVPGPIPPPS
jgi:L-gulonolactone oxidase